MPTKSNATETGFESVEQILDADLRRRAAISLPFDPIAGINSIGPRFRLYLPDAEIPVQFLPESMASEPLVADLRTAGSLAACAAKLGIPPEEVADRLTRLRHRHDFPFWAATSVWIKRKGGGADVTLTLNRPQRHLIAMFESMRLASLPIRLILLKARQWGGSTCTQLYMAWMQLTRQVGLNSLIIAHQGSGSDEIKDMFDRMMKQYPAHLLYDPDDPALLRLDPAKVKKMENVGRSGSIFRVPQRNCKVKIGTAERPDSCRGGDYNLVHLSEVGIWRATDNKSPEDIVRSACAGVFNTPETMIVYESTANGTGNFFHTEYLAAKRRESCFLPLFISWFEIDAYSKQLTDSERRILAGDIFANRFDDASSERRQSGRYLMGLFEAGATLDAIAWYIEERSKYNSHERMAAEFPSDDIEAFSNSGAEVFDRAAAETLRASCMPAPYHGDIVSDAPDGPECLVSPRFFQTPSGGLDIWKFPDSSEISNRYLAVVDVGGRSFRADWSVVAVFDREPMLRGLPPEVVAQWRGHCDTDILTWRAARIARFYRNALLVIESNTLETQEPSRGLDGDMSLYILTQIEDCYPNLYLRPPAPGSGGTMRPGFHTNTRTKPMIIATLVRAVREQLYVERCAACIDELNSYERRPNGSYGAIAGAHDDILMTRAIGLHIALHEMEPPHLRLPSQPCTGSYGPNSAPSRSFQRPRRPSPPDLAF